MLVTDPLSRCAAASRPRDWTSGSRATRGVATPLEAAALNLSAAKRAVETVERRRLPLAHRFVRRVPPRDALRDKRRKPRARAMGARERTSAGDARRGRGRALGGGRRRLPAGGAREAAGVELAGAARGTTPTRAQRPRVNVSRAGHFNALHDHAGASVSGVLGSAPPAPRASSSAASLFLALDFPARAPGARARRARGPRARRVPGRLAHAVLPLAPGPCATGRRGGSRTRLTSVIL